MKTNLNTSPYWDDFDEFKNFHQVLFRPGYAVQARELTQIQSILKNQITKFGNHVFKHGSVVIPGNSIAELGVQNITVGMYNLVDRTVNETTGEIISEGSVIDIQQFLGKVIEIPASSAGKSITAVVKAVFPRTATTDHTLYLGYLSGDGLGNTTFDVDQTITIVGEAGVQVKVLSKGVGSLANIGDGVFYVNGTFASVAKQSIVIDNEGSDPSCHVLLKITESIVTSADDETLLDPAQGSYNYAAPGADRLKIDLTLISLPLGTTFDEDYIELMRYNKGVLEEHSRYPKYNELEKSLARRTFDESGDYVVEGYNVSVREHLKTLGNNGVYPPQEEPGPMLPGSGDESKLVYDVSQGRAYINGFEVSSMISNRFVADKARTTKSLVASRNVSYGQYLLVSSIVRGFDISSNNVVNLMTAAAGGGVVCGTAKIIGFDHHDGAYPNAIYKAYVYDIQFTSTNSYANIGSIKYTAVPSGNISTADTVCEYDIALTAGTFAPADVLNSTGTRSGVVKYFNSAIKKLYVNKSLDAKLVPFVGDVIATGTNTATVSKQLIVESVGQTSLLFKLPTEATATIGNTINNTVYKKITIAANASTSEIVSDGTILALETGNFIPVIDTGILSTSSYTFTLSNDFKSINISPTINKEVACYVQVYQSNGTARTKNVSAMVTETVTASAKVTLANSDIVKLISVKDANDNDITNRYVMSDGCSDYSYNFGYITLKNGYSVPAGQIKISYTYFVHGGSGDCFTIDSYPEGYKNRVYRSPINGTEYNLRDCIDFRKDSTAADTVVIGSMLSCNVEYYVPRTDLVVLDKSGKISVITGEPSPAAVAPAVASEYHVLQRIKVPAYTTHITDVVSERTAVQRSTMKDILDISKRITRLEDYATLTQLESLSVQTELIDAKTGLNRFKTGYLTEDMSDPLFIADSFDPQFAASWNSGGLTAGIETVVSSLNLITPGIIPSTSVDPYAGSLDEYRFPDVVMTTSGYALHRGGFITLNYEEVVWASQPYSSRVTNINPFMIIAWNGTMNLVPNGDTWIDQVDRPEIFTTVNTQTVNVTEIVEVIWIAPPVEVPPQRPSTVPISVNNSLMSPGATGQTVFNVPIEAVNNEGNGIFTLNQNITAGAASEWIAQQQAAGLTHQRGAGETVGRIVSSDR